MAQLASDPGASPLVLYPPECLPSPLGSWGSGRLLRCTTTQVCRGLLGTFISDKDRPNFGLRTSSPHPHLETFSSRGSRSGRAGPQPRICSLDQGGGRGAQEDPLGAPHGWRADHVVGIISSHAHRLLWARNGSAPAGVIASGRGEKVNLGASLGVLGIGALGKLRLHWPGWMNQRESGYSSKLHKSRCALPAPPCSSTPCTPGSVCLP